MFEDYRFTPPNQNLRGVVLTNNKIWSLGYPQVYVKAMFFWGLIG